MTKEYLNNNSISQDLLKAVTFQDKNIKCPKCESTQASKNGHRRSKQNYLCRNCGLQFIDIYLYKSIDDEQITCPDCGNSKNCKLGKYKEEQKYKCKQCQRVFRKSSKPKLDYSQEFSWKSDIWVAAHIGVNPDSQNSHYFFNFSQISQLWLKEYAKKFIWFESANKTAFGTLRQYINSVCHFSNFLCKSHPCINDISDVNRALIIDFLNYLNQQKFSWSWHYNTLANLNTFFRDGSINNWFEISPYLILPEDFPKKTKRLPRYIPEEVMLHLNQCIDELPESVMRMVLVIQECGLRISELVELPFNCLKQDYQRNSYLQFKRWKMKKEDAIPISSELAQVIKEQQQYIRKSLGENYDYLFCATKSGRSSRFISKPAIMKPESFINYIKRLAVKFEIKDKSGKQWNFQNHQFRHTVGTRMINTGVPQHIVQRYLGHETPTMTMVYAHIHDETLRSEIEKYHESRVVNFQGETAELDKTILSSNNDLEWFKKNVQARALEHGYCARPKVLGNCDIPGFDGCYNCSHWRTNKNFLPILKDTLERTNNVLRKAQSYGWQLQVNKNTPIKENLEKVIKSLEVDRQ